MKITYEEADKAFRDIIALENQINDLNTRIIEDKSVLEDTIKHCDEIQSQLDKLTPEQKYHGGADRLLSNFNWSNGKRKDYEEVIPSLEKHLQDLRIKQQNLVLNLQMRFEE